jgi:phosphatidylglycerophosphate synthase
VWLAHALTLLRLPLIPVFWFGYGTPVAPAAIGLAALSDALDGTIARRAQKRRPPPSAASEAGARPHPWGPAWWTMGAWLDPLVDKLFIAGVLIAVLVRSPHDVGLVALIAVREVALVPLVATYEIVRRHRERVAIRARPLGKATTVLQMFAIAAIAGDVPGAWVLAVASAVVGVAATIDYVRVSTIAANRGS